MWKQADFTGWVNGNVQIHPTTSSSFFPWPTSCFWAPSPNQDLTSIMREVINQVFEGNTNWSHVVLLKIGLKEILISVCDSFHWDSLDLSWFSHLLYMIQTSNMRQHLPNSHLVSYILIRPGWPGKSARLEWKYPGWLLEISSSDLFFDIEWADEAENVTNVVLWGELSTTHY